MIVIVSSDTFICNKIAGIIIGKSRKGAAMNPVNILNIADVSLTGIGTCGTLQYLAPCVPVVIWKPKAVNIKLLVDGIPHINIQNDGQCVLGGKIKPIPTSGPGRVIVI